MRNIQNKNRNVEMLSGNILLNMIKFAWPIILTGILQSLYSTADNIVAGKMGGTTALSAIGASGTTIGVVTIFATTIFIGMNIILARQLGSGDDKAAQVTCRTGYFVALLLGALCFVVGQIISPFMLNITKCPEGEVYDGALLYLRIYFANVPFGVFSNYAFSIIRVNGDSSTPFKYLTLSGIVNVVLNVILVLIIGNAILAVAIATFVSVVMSAVMSAIHLFRLEGPCKLDVLHPQFDFPTFAKISQYGIPAFISSASYTFSNFIITPAVNSFGESGMAGSTAANNIEAYLYVISAAFTTVAATFIGQNLGAQNKERVKRSVITCYALSCGVALVISILGLIFSRQLVGLFISDNEEAVRFAIVRMNYVFSAAILQGLNAASGGSLQAFGRTSVQMVTNVVGVLIFRIVWMYAVYPQAQTPEVLWLCYPTSWIFTGVILLSVVVIDLLKYMKGKEFKL